VTGLLLQGVHLEEVWRQSQKGLDFVRKVRFRDFTGILLCQQRFILAMRGEAASFDEEKFEARLMVQPMPHFACHYWILKLHARFLLGRPTLLAESGLSSRRRIRRRSRWT
jgi:hypothetical protein